MYVIHNEKLVKKKGVQAARYSCKVFEDDYDSKLHEHFVGVGYS